MYNSHKVTQVDAGIIGNNDREEMGIMTLVMRIRDQESDSVDIVEPVVLEVGTRIVTMMAIRGEVEEDVGDMIGDHMVIGGDDTVM